MTFSHQNEFVENMSMADYFQAKHDTREMLSSGNIPESFILSVKKLCDSIQHTELLEEKTGIFDEKNLRNLLADRDKLLKFFAEKILPKVDIRNLLIKMVAAQELQQENMRNETEAFRTELFDCKSLIERFTKNQKIEKGTSPAFDARFLQSKIYQYIGSIDSARLKITENIGLVRASVAAKAGEISSAMKVVAKYALIPVKAVHDFFTQMRSAVKKLKNNIYYALDLINESMNKTASDISHTIVSNISDSLDTANLSLHSMTDMINGDFNLNDMLQNRIQLTKIIKDMVDQKIPESKIKKQIKEFSKEHNVEHSIIKEANTLLADLMKKKGISFS